MEAEHPIYSSGFDLSRTAALVAHRDEGRGRRRQAFFVASYHSVLGRGTVASQRVQKKEFLKMCLNMRGHTYVSRLMCGVLPRDVYADNEEVFQALLEINSSQLQHRSSSSLKKLSVLDCLSREKQRVSFVSTGALYVLKAKQ